MGRFPHQFHPVFQPGRIRGRAMYPLVQPAIEDIAEQIYDSQSLENIQYSSDSPYTSQLILQAVKDALEKARTS